MENQILSYYEMCQREGISLQSGMHFEINGRIPVLLMSVRTNAPYEDRIDENGSIIIYEGHDIPRSNEYPNPKLIDQQEFSSSGQLTQNGKFHNAAQAYKNGKVEPTKIRIYEKIKSGIWSYNGIFLLIDSWKEKTNTRLVYKFKLEAIVGEEDTIKLSTHTLVFRRIIPTHIKAEVWKRDGGKCCICGAKENLHFDHIIPWSKGGSSIDPANVQILCGKHNLKKSDKIE